jgi:hypothetical protein
MRLIGNLLLGGVLPIAALFGLVWWRAHSKMAMVIFSFEWWTWYASVIFVSMMMGAAMYRYWCHPPSRPVIRRRKTSVKPTPGLGP